MKLHPESVAQITNMVSVLANYCSNQTTPVTGHSAAVDAFDLAIKELQRAKLHYEESVWEGDDHGGNDG